MKYLIISYAPLIPLTPNTASLKSEETNKLQKILENLRQGSAKACLWVMKDDKPTPIFLIDQAKAIYEHLVAWSENEPEKWFQLAWVSQEKKSMLLH